eukprot:4452242-Amphidinium_carterae.1
MHSKLALCHLEKRNCDAISDQVFLLRPMKLVSVLPNKCSPFCTLHGHVMHARSCTTHASLRGATQGQE